MNQRSSAAEAGKVDTMAELSHCLGYSCYCSRQRISARLGSGPMLASIGPLPSRHQIALLGVWLVAPPDHARWRPSRDVAIMPSSGIVRKRCPFIPRISGKNRFKPSHLRNYIIIHPPHLSSQPRIKPGSLLSNNPGSNLRLFTIFQALIHEDFAIKSGQNLLKDKLIVGIIADAE